MGFKQGGPGLCLTFNMFLHEVVKALCNFTWIFNKINQLMYAQVLLNNIDEKIDKKKKHPSYITYFKHVFITSELDVKRVSLYS